MVENICALQYNNVYLYSIHTYVPYENPYTFLFKSENCLNSMMLLVSQDTILNLGNLLLIEIRIDSYDGKSFGFFFLNENFQIQVGWNLLHFSTGFLSSF